MKHYDIILTTTIDSFPPAFRQTAFDELAKLSNLGTDSLQNLLTQPRVNINTFTNIEEAEKQLEALQHLGWQAEIVIRTATPANLVKQSIVTAIPPSISAINNQATPQAHIQQQPHLPTTKQTPASLPPPLPTTTQTHTSLPPPLPSTPINQGSTPPPVPSNNHSTNLHATPRQNPSQKITLFSLPDLMAETFKKRDVNEIEEYLMAGALRNTPHLSAVPTKSTIPWFFMRFFIVAIIIYGLLYFAFDQTQNPNLIPGLILVGSFMMPMTTMLFLYEMNAPRNVSIWLLIKTFFYGGAISLLVSLMLFALPTDQFKLNASIAGPIEESGKLIAVILATRGLSALRYRFISNGLLFGAAVGAGFAAFESAGYAFNAYLETFLLVLKKTNNLATALVVAPDAMFTSIKMRGLLSPAAHVIWTALTAGALWQVRGANKFSASMLADWRFLRLFFFAVAGHMLWNADWFGAIFINFFGRSGLYVKGILFAIPTWLIAFHLMRESLKGIKAEQENMIETNR